MAPSAFAQAWPTRPVRLVAAFPPGTPGDVIARLIQPALQAAWNQPVVIENKTGAGGNLAAGEVAQAKDGHTLLVGPDTIDPDPTNNTASASVAIDPTATLAIEKTDEVAENTVISTDPAADTPALQGSTVAIVVAGPPDSVQVPGQVVGMTEIDARALLEAPPYQFTVTTAVQSSSTIPEGTVIELPPWAGAGPRDRSNSSSIRW